MGSESPSPAPDHHPMVEPLPDGRFRVHLGKVELGQGVVTALLQIAADELEVDLSDVDLATADAPTGPDQGFTAGSRSVMDGGEALRVACAEARHANDVRGAGRSGRASPRGARGDRRLVGESVPRVDLPDKFLGRPRFVHDLDLPAQLFGRVVRPPTPGATLERLDEVGVRDLPGVVAVVRRGSFLGVVAEEEDVAITAAETLRAATRWTAGDSLPTQVDLPAMLRSSPAEATTLLRRVDDDARRRVVVERRFSYFRPYLAHAAIGPSAAAAVHAEGRIEVWTHAQGVYPLQRAIASGYGVEPDAVSVHHVEGPGCYGHNGADDVAYDAVLLAAAVPGRPVHVTWSREDEFAWEPYGPAMVVDVQVGTDEQGTICTWKQDSYGNGHTARPGHGGEIGLLAGWLQVDERTPPSGDPPLAAGAGNGRNIIPGYSFPDVVATAHRSTWMPLRTSSLRSLGAMANVLAIECTLDQLAESAGVDPLAYRLRHCDDDRAREVMEAVARLAAWHDRPRREGHGWGLAYARYKGICAYCAVVAEVEAVDDVRVKRLFLAADPGEVINPDGVANQLEGGAIQAASWTVREQVNFDQRSVTSRDWETYPILSFSEVPTVEVTVLDRPALPSLGVGECAVGPVTAAIANALADALGVHVGSLPFTGARVAQILAAE